MSNNVRIYRGLARRERAGWVMGLTPWQALSVVALAVPVLWTLASGQFWTALVLAVACGLLACLVVVPVRGRPAFRWLWHLIRYQIGVVGGWSSWQSRAASGSPVALDDPDLPGVLQRIRFPDGPAYRDRDPVCLIHDTGYGRWGATAQLTHSGVGLLSDEQCERLASRLGNVLLSVGHRDVIDRLSLLVRTVPDDGTEYEAWRREHEVAEAPSLARRATDELDRTIGSLSVRHEIFVTVTGSEDALRKPATAAGGGVEGRAQVLYRALDGLEDQLKGLGVDSVDWLSSGQLAAAIRTGFNPGAAAALDREKQHHPDSELPRAVAGPTQAPSPPWRRYDHDAYSTVSYSVLMPEAGTVFGALSPLLAVRAAGERRCLAVHYEVMDARRASREVQNYRFRAGVLRDYKRSQGFSASAADEREAGGARDQERAVAAGHSLVRYAVVGAVTVPTSWPVEDHAARMENDVAGRFRLLRLDLAQDSSFVAACLPIGVGLPRSRGGLL